MGRRVLIAVTIELQSQRTQTEFNLHRWAELLEDRELAKVEGRIETDRHGQIIMSPPPAPSHGSLQIQIGRLLDELMPDGEAISECPISTADGVKAADVAWASARTMKALGKKVCFPTCPEICVEVISPSNSEREIAEKMALFFDAGAKEVWLCSPDGEMKFFVGGEARAGSRSKLCPEFPKRVKRRS